MSISSTLKKISDPFLATPSERESIHRVSVDMRNDVSDIDYGRLRNFGSSLAGSSFSTNSSALATTMAASSRAIGSGIIEPKEPLAIWRQQGLDGFTLAREKPSTLLEIMCDISPDLSRGLWDFLRFCNPGWSVKVFKPGTETEHRQGAQVVKEFFALLEDTYGSLDIIFSRLFNGVFLKGGFLAEIVLGSGGRGMVDLATPDPGIIRFREIVNEGIVKKWQMGYLKGFNEFVDITSSSVRYIPVDPFSGSPYGRPLATPALFSVIFLVTMLHDLRRVVAQQGYPRIDIEIRLDELAKTIPQSELSDPAKFQIWVDSLTAKVKDVYGRLEPDHAYVHTNIIQINKAVGAVDASSLGAVKNLVDSLERMAMRALKSVPLIMGIASGVGESNANRQWEIHAAGIKSIQHGGESLMERHLEYGLRSLGIVADVKFRFAELRSAERMRDAQVEQLQITNEGAKWLWGLISLDEMALKLTGHKPDVAEPRLSDGGPVKGEPKQTDPAQVSSDPSSQRMRSYEKLANLIALPKIVEINGGVASAGFADGDIDDDDVREMVSRQTDDDRSSADAIYTTFRKDERLALAGD